MEVKINMDSKERVSKIIEKRQNYIQMVCDLVKSDRLITRGNRSLGDAFLNWLVANTVIMKYIPKIIERHPETRKERKLVKLMGRKITEIGKERTDEFRLLKSAYFDANNITFNSYDSPDAYRGSMINLDSEAWEGAKNIMDIMFPCISIYVEEHYKTELNRLCPLKENLICEHCGEKNDTCNQFCSDCGTKL